MPPQTHLPMQKITVRERAMISATICSCFSQNSSSFSAMIETGLYLFGARASFECSCDKYAPQSPCSEADFGYPCVPVARDSSDTPNGLIGLQVKL